jgi:hypothetical protein
MLLHHPLPGGTHVDGPGVRVDPIALIDREDQRTPPAWKRRRAQHAANLAIPVLGCELGTWAAKPGRDARPAVASIAARVTM